MYCSKCGAKLEDGETRCPACDSNEVIPPETEKKKDGTSDEQIVFILGIVAASLFLIGMSLPALVVSIVAVVYGKKLKNKYGALEGNTKLGYIFAIIVLAITGVTTVLSVVSVIIALIGMLLNAVLGLSIMFSDFSDILEFLELIFDAVETNFELVGVSGLFKF